MNPVLDRAVYEPMAAPAPHPILSSERPLRVAAATLTHGTAGAITATTVVGVLGLDDVDAFHLALDRICDDFGVDARVRLNVGSYAVRFSRRVDPEVAAVRADGLLDRALHLLQRRR